MSQTAFADALEVVERLGDDDQAELAAVVKRRLAERGRARVVASVAEARRELAAGLCQEATVEEIMREAMS